MPYCRIHIILQWGKGEDPTHEGPLAQCLIISFLIDRCQCQPLADIKTVHTGEHDGAHEQTSITAVDGRRSQQRVIETLRLLIPQRTDEDMIEEQRELMLVLRIDFF